MGEEKLLILSRAFVRANLPDMASDVCIAALDAAEGASLAEAASDLRAISEDTAFAMKLMTEYVEK